MPRKVTLKDIAREVGLSESAVSQVLNDRPCRLAEESKERIRRTAARLDYRVNQVARGLAINRSNTIGLIIPDIENPFFSSLAKHLEECCRETGYGLFITNSGDDVQNECDQLRRLDARGVDGIVLVSGVAAASGDSAGAEGILRTLSCPYVMVDRIVPAAPCDKVLIDNQAGAYLATSYLLDHGHSRIACLVNTRHSSNGADRLAGFEHAMTEAKLRPAAIVECDYHVEDGYRAADQIPRGTTAVFSTSDLITAGLLKRLYERGQRVPDDLSVVSFDNNAAFILGGPGITSVEQDTRELARQSFGLLAERIDGCDGEPREQIIEPRLVEKASVARL